MLRVPTPPMPSKQRLADHVKLPTDRETGRPSSTPTLTPTPTPTPKSLLKPAIRLGQSRSHGDVRQLGTAPEDGGHHEEGRIKRPDSAEFLTPFLPFAEIPPEKGLRRAKSLLRQVARKARRNLLHHSTHDCSIPADCREQLKHIYVY